MPPLTRRRLLGALAGASIVGWSARGAEPRRRLILVVSSGGWDPTFTIDPKPDLVLGGPYPDLTGGADDEVVVEYGDIRVSTNEARRPSVRRFFDAFAESSVVVNGLWTQSLSHWTAMDRVLTGSDAPDAPDVAAIVGVASGSDLPLATIDLAGLGRFGPLAPSCARAGVRAQLAALLDPSLRIDAPSGPRPAWAPTDADREAIRGYLAARGGREGGAEAWAERLEALERAAALRSASDAVTELPFGRRTTFQDQVPYAVQLLAGGTCHSVLLGTGFAWDTHADASRQHGSWDDTFAGLGILASRLEDEGLLGETLVVALSELGRSPERNAAGGTDHWPYTSAVVFGGGVRGGRVVGATDAALLGLGVDRATGLPSESAPLLDGAGLLAGVLAAVGVDPGAWLPGVEPVRGLV